MTEEDYLLDASVRESMDNCASTPPLLTITWMETNRAFFVNRLRSKGFAKSDAISVVQDTLLVNWLGSTEDRLLQDVARLNRNQDGVQKPRLNQHNAPKTFIGNIDAMVTVAKEEMERKRTKSKRLQPGKLGTYLFFDQQEIKVAKAMGGSAKLDVCSVGYIP